MRWDRRGFVVQLGSMLLLPIAPSAWAYDRPPVKWHTDYLRAQRLRAARKRPMLIFLTMDGCPHCHEMMRSTYEDAGIAREAAERFVLALINGSQQKLLAAQFGVRVYPTTYLVAPDNRVLDRIEGFVPPEALRERLALASAQVEKNSGRRASP
jgi:thioredoxin-like negative regulator of GroEL